MPGDARISLDREQKRNPDVFPSEFFHDFKIPDPIRPRPIAKREPVLRIPAMDGREGSIRRGVRI